MFLLGKKTHNANGRKVRPLTDGLQAFNEWRDDFLIEASTLLLMIGFIVGTVDVFTKGSISTTQIFNVAWAIVQAVAIDGLFFAVWGKIARASWIRKNGFQNSMLLAVGLLLSVVATLVNGILSYQQLANITDVNIAMSKLGINQDTFTYTRSILVIIVAILVAVFCRSKRAEEIVHLSTHIEEEKQDAPSFSSIQEQVALPQPEKQKMSQDDMVKLALNFLESHPLSSDIMLLNYLQITPDELPAIKNRAYDLQKERMETITLKFDKEEGQDVTTPLEESSQNSEQNNVTSFEVERKKRGRPPGSRKKITIETEIVTPEVVNE